MNYDRKDITRATSYLAEKYPDTLVDNNMSIGSTTRRVLPNIEYIKLSKKRSNIKNIEYKDGDFQYTAFAGSSFHAVTFNRTLLKGNAFTSCDFYASEFWGGGTYEANNFSQSNLTSCLFQNSEFVSCSMLQTLFNRCKLLNTIIQSCTLEGSHFIACELNNVDIGSTNIEYVELLNTKLDHVIFPFYQFPYIIGAAEYVLDLYSTVTFRAGEREISMHEYKEQLNNLLLYYCDKSEYFPMCNLYIAMGNNAAAKEHMLTGINTALHDLNFRMIRHYCRLSQRHNLLDESTAAHIIQTIEEFLAGTSVPAESLNLCLIHLGEIRNILYGGGQGSVKLRINIRTNVCQDDTQGVKYVSVLSNELISALSEYRHGQVGYQVAVSRHSPYEIVVEVLTGSAQLATVANLIWRVIDSRHKHKVAERETTSPNGTMIDTDTYRDYVNSRVELCKEQLLKIKSSYSTKKMNSYIEEITQQLQTDLDALYKNVIMIFKIQNNSGSR